MTYEETLRAKANELRSLLFGSFGGPRDNEINEGHIHAALLSVATPLLALLEKNQASLKEISFSMTQAEKFGNDYRREIKRSKKIAEEALACQPVTEQGAELIAQAQAWQSHCKTELDELREKEAK